MVSGRSDLVDVFAIIKHRTDKAVLVDHGAETPVWLPLSQVEIEPSDDGRGATITLPEWLAVAKGFI